MPKEGSEEDLTQPGALKAIFTDSEGSSPTSLTILAAFEGGGIVCSTGPESIMRC